jgi:hypothetical protein
MLNQRSDFETLAFVRVVESDHAASRFCLRQRDYCEGDVSIGMFVGWNKLRAVPAIAS